ncbi:MAG: xanthine dehydrogenase family protein, partial [Xanthobacteraceae bacterium]
MAGRGAFAGDINFPHQLHMRIVRSAHAHGRIAAIDTAAARALPGVYAVWTAADIADVPPIDFREGSIPALDPYRQPVLATDRVRYVGDPIAAVFAADPYIAEDAADLVTAEIEELPPLLDAQAPPAEFSPGHSSEAAIIRQGYGDVDAVFRDAPHVVEVELAVGRHSGVPLETRGAIGRYDASRGILELHGAAKVPHRIQELLSRMLGLPPSGIHVHESHVGGGFGVRGDFFPEDYLVPFAAHQVGRPVKWVESRRENLLASSHAREADAEIEIACGTDGTVLALAGRIRVDMGCYIRNAAEVPPRNAALFITGPYRIPNSRFEAAMVLTNKAPVGTYRAPGRFEADFFRERMFDMAARDLGIDPVEFRRRTLVTAAEMPYAIASITPSYGESQVEFDGGSYTIALDRCLDEIGWKEKSASRGKLIGDRYHGLGVGCFIEAGGAGPREHARIALETDGTVSVFVGSSNIGQGLETVCTQIAGDALNCSMDAIKVFHGSTTYLKDGVG